MCGTLRTSRALSALVCSMVGDVSMTILERARSVVRAEDCDDVKFALSTPGSCC